MGLRAPSNLWFGSNVCYCLNGGASYFASFVSSANTAAGTSFDVVPFVQGYIGLVCSIPAVLWATYTASRFYEKVSSCKSKHDTCEKKKKRSCYEFMCTFWHSQALHMEHMKMIIALPVLITYSIFVLVAIF